MQLNTGLLYIQKIHTIKLNLNVRLLQNQIKDQGCSNAVGSELKWVFTQN